MYISHNDCLNECPVFKLKVNNLTFTKNSC